MNTTYSLPDIVKYFLKLGAIGFGGPAALVGYMHRDLVEDRNWIKEQDYKEGLALAQLAPGPLAAQLAIYIGYIDFGILGATLAGIAFVIPSFIMVVILGWLYIHFGGLPWMQAVFYGVGAAVIGIITLSTYKLSRKSLGRDWLLWSISLVLTVFTFLGEKENIGLMLLAGFVVWFVRSPPRFLKLNTLIFFVPVFLQAGIQLSANERLAQIGWFFLKAGAFVFGSGLAIVPFLYGGVVNEFHWLSEKQFLDAVAVAMIT
ncbi:MAG TPA: chromate efflux transporter, partial [Puia sp.]|nr:chromate efflux transporter [Puia sp.]